MSIQYASDIHLEHEKQKTENFKHIIAPRIGCDILILAGDISDPKLDIFHQFMKWCVQNWKYVIMIAGNHEYYKYSISEINTYLSDVSITIGFSYLNNNSIIINDIAIMGTTLWSYIPDQNWSHVLYGLNDFNYIKEFKEKYSIYNNLYSENCNWLTKELKKYKHKKKVVVTHHAPVEEITSAFIYRGKPTNCAFASNCDDMLELADIWIYGHTHFNNYPIIRKKCNVLSNQRGYRGNCKNYRKQACIVIN